MTTDVFVNKVEASGIIALDLINYKPELEVVPFDIKDLLYKGMIVREKEFKSSIAKIDFNSFIGKAVAIFCSVDAIIPTWIYMVLAEKLHGKAEYVGMKEPDAVELDLWIKNLINADLSEYNNEKVVVRARLNIDPVLYYIAAERLLPVVNRLMYGEIGMPKVIFKK